MESAPEADDLDEPLIHDDYDDRGPLIELITTAAGRLTLIRDSLDEIRPMAVEAEAGIDNLDPDDQHTEFVAAHSNPDQIREAVDGIRRSLTTLDATLNHWLAIADRIDLPSS